VCRHAVSNRSLTAASVHRKNIRETQVTLQTRLNESCPHTQNGTRDAFSNHEVLVGALMKAAPRNGVVL